MKAPISLTLLGLLSMCGLAAAEIGAVDQVPAASLLVPYFEVDLKDPSGTTTLISINNASPKAALANVTLWTDEAILTLNFNVYLTGYDVQTINLRDIFNGYLPVTADRGADPSDTMSPRGRLSEDADYPGVIGPCSTPYLNPALTAVLIDHLRKAHTGQPSPNWAGRCGARSYGDNVARGYVLVDLVTQCNNSVPTDAFFFTSFGDRRNIVWGDYTIIEPATFLTLSGPLLHLEACSTPSVGNGAGQCPFVAGDYTFYGRYNTAAADQREPLPTTFATRYAEGGPFSTDLIVWRDTKAGSPTPHPCNSTPGWYPLGQYDVIAFDEEENPVDLCPRGDGSSPTTVDEDACFPAATQRIRVSSLDTPFPFGWLYLNLNHRLRAGDPFPGVAQAWVITLMQAQGARGFFAGDLSATPLDNAISTRPGGVILIH